MKKLILLLTLTACILLVPGCGFITEKITNKVAGEILENAAGEDVDIDVDEGKVVIKDEDGSEMVIGGTEWPKGAAGQSIPVFEGGKIDYVTDYAISAMISVKEVTKDDYSAYVEKLKAEGFTENSANLENEGALTYVAYKTDTHYASVSFDGSDGMIISVATE